MLVLRFSTIPLLKLLQGINHFDKEGAALSRMRRVMAVVKEYAIRRNVWKPKGASNYWKGDTVTKLWDAVWLDMGPHLVTVTKLAKGQGVTYHKSRTGALSWRTCHDKLRSRGVFDQFNL